MGTGNLFHKRKERSLESLKRKKNKREAYAVILIVCEGEKTEPNYLNGLCEDLKLNRANIKIIPCPIGNDPMSIVKYGLQEFAKNKYDGVYCVFDKEYSNYQAALNKIQTNFTKAKNSIPIYAITSVPCFEYWLLLHFVNSAKPYRQVSNKSPGDQLMSEIKNHLSDYHKGYLYIYERVKTRLNEALLRAKRIDKQQEENGTDNPSTKIYMLVEYLINLKK